MDKSNLFVSAGLTVFGISASFAALNYPEGSRMLPLFYSALLVLLSGALLLQSMPKNPKKADSETEPLGKVLKVVIFVASYIFLIPHLGFYSSTACFLLFFMVATRAARFCKALIVSGVATLVIYAFFELFLRVPAPQGLWI